jgi:hypothetical protein
VHDTMEIQSEGWVHKERRSVGDDAKIRKNGEPSGEDTIHGAANVPMLPFGVLPHGKQLLHCCMQQIVSLNK